jgi:AraC family transcriptional activator of pobA
VAAVAAGFERIPSFFLYGEAAHEQDERLVHVATIALRSARHHWKIRPHLHRRLHQLILVLRGRGVSLAEGSGAEFAPPALTVVPAGAVHGFDFEPGTQGFVVSIADELLREITQREGAVAALFENPATLELDATALKATELPLSFEMLSRELSRTLPGHTLALEGLLTVILANGLRLSQVSVDSAEGGVGHRRLLVSRFASSSSVCFARTGRSPITRRR